MSPIRMRSSKLLPFDVIRVMRERTPLPRAVIH
jgi:hypothetical protein